MSARSFLAVAAVALTLAATYAVRAEKSADPVATLDVPAMTDRQVALAAGRLRDEGPAGLEKALAAYDAWILSCGPGSETNEEIVEHDLAWRELIALVAQQKDADVSRLYWYTDWESAQAEAKRTGKPVVRLFMMGRLTDNLSCANSRFFRVAFYANEGISKFLRENYVLCWTSVRPVPVITVDYGDGRKLERTVTGNSIHYIVNADGQLIDVMPGLVGPQNFLSWLIEGEQKFATSQKLEEPLRTEELRGYHASALRTTIGSWHDLRGRLMGEPLAPPTIAPTGSPTAEGVSITPAPGVPPQAAIPPTPTSNYPPGAAPTAVAAAPISRSKALVELPLVNEIASSGPAPAQAPVPAASISAESDVTDTYPIPTVPTAVEAAPISIHKGKVERPLVAQIVAAPTPALPADAPVPTPPTSDLVPTSDAPATVPTAVEAAPLAPSKRRVELPLVNEVVGANANAALATAIGKYQAEAPLVAEVTSTDPTPPTTAPVATESILEQVGPPTPLPAGEPVRPIAAEALLRAVSKSAIEAPFVTTIAGREEIPQQIAAMSDADWDRFAELFSEESDLDESSIALMHRLYSDPEAPTEETCPTATIESFERSIALDTARNLYLHRRAILEWIYDEGLPTDLVAFNERVYGELFLTPSSDPWIGLVPQDVFTGIDREGLFEN